MAAQNPPQEPKPPNESAETEAMNRIADLVQKVKEARAHLTSAQEDLVSEYQSLLAVQKARISQKT